MPNRIESSGNKQRASEEPDYNDAVTTAVGSIAAHFLRENKEKGRTLKDVSRGVIIYPDGHEEK